MGEAKRRGSREQRVAEAQIRMLEEERVRLERQMEKRRQKQRLLLEAEDTHAEVDRKVHEAVKELPDNVRSRVHIRPRGKSWVLAALALLNAESAQTKPKREPETFYIDELTEVKSR